MEKGANIAAALFAFAAAIFWFLSAYGKLPRMITYPGYTPDTDPFFKAVKFSAMMNRWAAAFSGLSALCAGVGLFIR
jgi:hypothetical protein